MSSQDSDLEKTEPASERRIEQAREEGNVARSRELAACVSLVVGGLLLWIMGASLESALALLLKDTLSFPRALAFEPALLLEHGRAVLGRVLWVMLPFGIIVLAAVMIAPLLVGGWLFSSKAFLPKFDRLDPIAGIGRLFSLHSLAELGKALAKTVLVGAGTFYVVRSQSEELFALASVPVGGGDGVLGHLLFLAFATLAGVLALVAIVDVPWQRWQYAKKLMMTREEVRKEHKEQEGNPEIKARIRAQQREMARRRMMAEVPKADVIVTNPTHYAVALKYTDGRDAAPLVLAKGADDIAAKIREIAEAHAVPMLEAPPLARALYRHAEPGEPVPEKLYSAVAQVLAWVFQLRAGGKPERPTGIEVPAGMDILPVQGAVGGDA